MAKFKKHLAKANRTFIDIIREDVNDEFKRFVISNRHLVYRGIPGLVALYYDIKTPRKDRRPMNMSSVDTSKLDKYFFKKFGWKPRSEGVFTSDEKGAKGYGELCSFWPLGDFKYVFCPGIWDLFIQKPGVSEYEVDAFCRETGTKIPQKIARVLEEIDKARSACTTKDREILKGLKLQLQEMLYKLVVSAYQDHDLEKAFDTPRVELIFKCDSYLAIPDSAETTEMIFTSLQE